jgi:hypothetical protein
MILSVGKTFADMRGQPLKGMFLGPFALFAFLNLTRNVVIREHLEETVAVEFSLDHAQSPYKHWPKYEKADLWGCAPETRLA